MRILIVIFVLLSLVFLFNANKNADLLLEEKFMLYKSSSIQKPQSNDFTSSGDGEFIVSTFIVTTTDAYETTSGDIGSNTIETIIIRNQNKSESTPTTSTSTSSIAFFTTMPTNRLEVRVSGSVKIQVSIGMFKNESFKVELTNIFKESTFTSLKTLIPELIFFRFYELIEKPR
jgi:hypothetical protein